MHIPTSLATAVAAAAICSSAAAQIASAPCYETAVGTNLGIGDEAVAQNVALGFTFPGPAGPITSIDVSSNGFVWLASNNNPDCCDGDETYFLSDLPRIAAFWTDLDPSSGNGVFFNSIPGSGSTPSRAVITWDCPEYGNATSNVLVQLQLLSDGSVVICQGPTTSVLQYHSPLVGITAGNNAAANQVDFSSLSGAPLNSGATIYDWMPFDWMTNLPTYDLAGRSFEFIPNGQGGYLAFERTGCRYAGFARYGRGCPQPASFYEFFPFGGNPLDLSNTSLQFLPTGGGYVVLAGTNPIWTGFTNNLNMLDDDVQGPFTLPFAFPHAGGVTSSIDVCSNGNIYLNSGVNSSSRCCNGDPLAFVTEDASIAALWMDLYAPGAVAGGGVFFDVDTVNQVAYITWNNVPEYFNVGSNTVQVALYASGMWELRYGAIANLSHDVLVGYTVGNGVADSGSMDISAVPWSTGNTGTPVTLDAAVGSLPRLNSTFTLDIAGVPAASPLGFVSLSFGSAALDLTPLGAPGCNAYVNLANAMTGVFLANNGTGSYSMPIPNRTSLIGLTVYAQAATFSNINALGVITSNGGRMDIGM